ncbi:MAG: hypothetical protein AABW90_03675 [Nanoarchaeota archaeon]
MQNEISKKSAKVFEQTKQGKQISLISQWFILSKNKTDDKYKTKLYYIK